MYLYAPVIMLQSLEVWAQKTEYTPWPGNLDFLAVTNITLRTTDVLEYGQIIAWKGEGLHAGIEHFRLNLFNCKIVFELHF